MLKNVPPLWVTIKDFLSRFVFLNYRALEVAREDNQEKASLLGSWLLVMKFHSLNRIQSQRTSKTSTYTKLITSIVSYSRAHSALWGNNASTTIASEVGCFGTLSSYGYGPLN